MNVRKLSLLAQAGVPIIFLNKGEVGKMREVFEEAKKELPREELKVIEEYVKNPPTIIPPDVRGKRWSYYKAVDLVNEYWKKVVEVAEKNPEVKRELENLIGENIEDMRFSNYEVHYALAMRTPPENLRSTRIALLLLLLKIAVEKGDIGRTGRGEVITRIADFYLSRVKNIDWKRLESRLKKVLAD